MSACRSVLEKSHNALTSYYNGHISAIQALQHTLIKDILPDVLDDMEAISVSYEEEGVRQWTRDSEHIFRMFKRHEFTTSFTLQALRASLVWRLTSLSVLLSPMSDPRFYGIIQMLPRSCHDPYNRPIAVLNLSAFLSLLENSIDDAKYLILLTAENLRLCLRQLNEECAHDNPILQCVMIIDVEGASWSNSGPDLLSWYLHDVQPHFPGMLAAVFIQGHSWIHSQMWRIIKRLLPPSSQSKVVFFSRQELVDYFGPNALPGDYGGCLPPSQTLNDSLSRHSRPHSTRNSAPNATHFVPGAAVPITAPPPRPVSLVLPTHSSINPFFGYPIYSSMRPRHGRRRKRDLLKTLMLLWWTKWKRTIILLASAGIILWVTKRKISWLTVRGKMWLTVGNRALSNALLGLLSSTND